MLFRSDESMASWRPSKYCSKDSEEVGEDEEEEDGAWLVSMHNAYTAADVPWTYMLPSLSSLISSLLPSPCLSFTDGALQAAAPWIWA